MNHTKKHQQIAVLVVAASLLAAPMALADVVTDWNIKAGEIVVEAKLPTATCQPGAGDRPDGRVRSCERHHQALPSQ